jgi:RNA polymerase sigma-70 factor (ECF subfamily)
MTAIPIQLGSLPLGLPFGRRGQPAEAGERIISLPRRTATERAVQDQSDESLLAAYLRGDRAAFPLLINRYRDELLHFLTRFLGARAAAEDVFQETFLQVHLSGDRFDPERRFKPWLFTIAANKAKDALRKSQRSSAVPIGAISEAQDMSFDEMLNALGSDNMVPYDELEKNETAAQVNEVIAGLPENLRAILILAYFNKFSYKQMADVLSIPIGTVKSRLHTAVAKFANDWKAAVGSREVK